MAVSRSSTEQWQVFPWTASLPLRYMTRIPATWNEASRRSTSGSASFRNVTPQARATGTSCGTWIYTDVVRRRWGTRETLLPSLTKITVVDASLYELSILYDALMKRVEQGVPVDILDLSMCFSSNTQPWLQSLTELVVDILGPEESREELEQMKSMWETVARGPFGIVDDFGQQRYL